MFSKLTFFHKILITFVYYYINQYSIAMDEDIYKFCFTQDKPQTLIMIKNVKKIAPLIIVPAQEAIFVFISHKNDKNSIKIKAEIEQLTKIKLICFQNIQQFKSNLQKQKRPNTVAIFMVDFYTQALHIQKLYDLKAVFFFSNQKKYNKYLHQFQGDEERIVQFKHNVIKEKQILISHIKLLNPAGQYRILPNFVFVENETIQSHILVRTLHSMLNQRIDQSTEDKINEQLKILLDEVNKTIQLKEIKKLDSFLKCIKQDAKPKQILYWYFSETFIYKILNNLLRSHRNPTEIFIIQPYFKKLFNCIKNLFLQQINHQFRVSQGVSFVCFRGGHMKQQQFRFFQRNKGSVVQNLGYLSSSMSKQIAEKFMKNVLFKITVEFSKFCQYKSEFGFADISKFSFYKEQQILFNPLNNFEIIAAYEDNPKNLGHTKYHIQLKYKTFNKDSQKQQMEERWRKIFELQKEEELKNQCQGNALSNQYDVVEEGRQYWAKYLQILKAQQKKTGIANINKLKLAYGLFNQSFSRQRQINNRFHYLLYEPKWFLILVDLLGFDHEICKGFHKSIEGIYEVPEIENLKKKEVKLTLIQQKQLKRQPEYIFFLKIYNQKTLKIEKKLYHINHKIILNHMHRRQRNPAELVNILQKSILQKDRDLIFLIDLQNNRLQNIFLIQKFKSLQELNISNNLLTEIPEGVLTLKQLKILHAENNRIKFIPMKLYDITTMTSLKIHGNKIQDLPSGIQALFRLEVLSISKNLISSLPEGIQKLTSLQFLNISENRIKKLPIGLAFLPKLQTFYLTNNQISLYPFMTASPPLIKCLDFSKNCLKQINQVGKQTYLMQKLHFSSNHLKFLPSFLENFVRLKILHLSNNKIAKLPKGIGNLFQLVWMDLSKNKIVRLPRSFQQLISLQRLNLSQNKLMKLPKGMENLIRLKRLNLSKNNLKKVPSSFMRFPKLIRLNLSSNQCLKIESQYQKIKRLRRAIEETSKLPKRQLIYYA